MSKYKIIDTDFRVVHEMECEFLGTSSCGRLLCELVEDSKVCYLDVHGKVVVETEFDWATPFFPKTSLAWAMIRRGGDQFYGVIDVCGNVIIEAKYSHVDPNSEGLIPAGTHENRDSYGYLDLTGKFVIPQRYKWASRFSCGLAGVEFPDNEFQEIYFINANGERVLGPYYESVQTCSFDENGMTVLKDPTVGKRVVIDTRGRVIASGWGNLSINDYSHGIVEVFEEIDETTFKFGYRDVYGNVILDVEYDEGMIRKGYIIAKKKDWWMIHDRRGQPVVDMRFKKDSCFKAPTCGILQHAEVDKRGQIIGWRYLNLQTGKVSPMFESAEPFSEGFAVVE